MKASAILSIVVASILSIVEAMPMVMCQKGGSFIDESSHKITSYVFTGTYGETGTLIGNCKGVVDDGYVLCSYKICPSTDIDCIYVSGSESATECKSGAITGGTGMYLGASGWFEGCYPGVKMSAGCADDLFTHTINLM